MLWRALICLGLAGPALALTPLLGLFANVADGPGIQFAEYTTNLDTYPHRIMGSIREKDQLSVTDDAGNSFQVILSKTNPGHVFEDIKPHIGDVDGDGINDVTVIETSLRLGASLAVYSVKNGALRKIAQTPFVGQRNRWFAQAGIGDFNADGRPDVAFVDRPHLARTLRIYSFIDGRFQRIAAASGVTNHAIGDETIWSGQRRCNGRDEVVLKSQVTATFIALWVDLDSDQITARDTGIKASPATLPQALRC